MFISKSFAVSCKSLHIFLWKDMTSISGVKHLFFDVLYTSLAKPAGGKKIRTCMTVEMCKVSKIGRSC